MTTVTTDLVRVDEVREVHASHTAATQLRTAAESCAVDSPDGARAAAILHGDIQQQERAMEEARKALVQPLNDHVKWINSKFRPAADILAAAKDLISRKILAYDTARRLEAERASEAHRKEEERLRGLAEKAEDAGRLSRAEEYSARADEVALAPVPEPEDLGVGTRTTWRGEVVDMVALCAAIAAGTVPSTILKVDSVALNRAATAFKGTVSWPGVTWLQVKGLVQRRGA